MNEVSGQIVLAGGQAGLPSLTVHVYATPERAVPAHVLDESQWDELSGAGWKGFELSRVGSAASDGVGRFRLGYEAETVARAHLWLAATAPDLTAAQPCPRVVGVCCEVRTEPAAREHMVLPVSARRLHRFGAFGPASSAERHGAAPGRLFALLDKAAAAAPAPALGGTRYSLFHARRHEAALAEMAARGQAPARAGGFALGIAAGCTQGCVLGEDVSVTRDPASGALGLLRPAGGDVTPLAYAGLRRSPAGASGRPALLEIDERSGAFQLRLARVPDRLSLEDARDDPEPPLPGA
ncbi:hypothetical protein LNKW23_13420 [Paralimibaculum aggregatum]|uniref:Uncharacterized protein n=1 Tax=Paralimibaculum aggregatum TaxID=3036245 RepID=A0ABQ6LFL9_9RHOB|nr:hypothetical protein [Limibaculum sp. NKW23]GMG82129.1 hypothetical protein LNKW23_13420 [Limibaculum sp. NKW23]